MSEREELAAAIIMHRHPQENALTRPVDALEMVQRDPEFFVCAAALAESDAILASDWLAAHDADLRERIALAIEACPANRHQTFDGGHECISQKYVARLARTAEGTADHE